MRNTMVLYTSYLERCRRLTDEQFGKLFRFVFQYQIDGELPQIDDVAVSMAFEMIKYDLDVNNQKFEEVCEKRRIAGAKGGQAKATKSKQKLPNATKSKQNIANLAESESDNESDNESESDNEKRESKAKRFTPPTVNQVEEYCRENNFDIDAQRFVDFYSSKGWMVGKNKMKDWKASVRNWVRRQDENKVVQMPKHSEDENTLKRREKYAELERYYLGEE